MRDRNVSLQRRSLLRLPLIAVAAAALDAALRSGLAHAVRKPVPPGIPLLSPEDSQAKALGYAPDVTELNAEKAGLATSPDAAGQRCSNCQLYSGTPGSEWGPCAIFSYRTDPITRLNLVVSADGWCKGWAPRAG